MWKIYLGYNTTEKNTVAREDYNTAFPIYDFRPFEK